MSSNLEVLQAEVLRLSPADRACLLDRLVASLDVDANVEATWDAVADQREQELDAGAVAGVPLEPAIARLIFPPRSCSGAQGRVMRGMRTAAAQHRQLSDRLSQPSATDLCCSAASAALECLHPNFGTPPVDSDSCPPRRHSSGTVA
ncbi:addiction module protein [Aquincola tertiaricarbonis]|uniref:Addiction module protein n=1 Tax=Aquincola tertiaricarbonis TaxID=391953 RepID=A0ABY4S6F7_AQUTE|nr:addiction module protein [Aquincola tertiaricarbonis]URI07496.1 addiction module protein [Aquincola tertiaricarbonis]